MDLLKSDLQNIHLKHRPMFDIVHTNVSQLNITTTSTTFDADNSYTFDVRN